MDNQEKDFKNDYEVEIDTELTEDNKLSIQEQIYELEIRMQELDVQIEQYEDSLYNSNEEEISSEKLIELTEEYKRLRKEKRLLSKQLRGKWDQIPVWLFLYGIFQIIFSSFVVLVKVSMEFTTWFLGVIEKSTEFWVTFSFLMIPIISVIITTVILIIFKNKARKKFLAVVLAIQFLETVIALLIMLT